MKDINRIIRYLKAVEPKLKIYKFTELPVLGRISYTRKWIKLSCPTERLAIFTLLHEGGHLLSFKRNYKKVNNFEDDFNRDRREILAYLYGWALIKILNIDISKDEWKDFK